MDKDQISKIEEIIERHLFEELNPTEYALKKMDVIVKYLIYQKLKDIDERLDNIDQTLYESANPGIWYDEK